MHFAWLLLRSSRIPSLSEQALANLCPAFFFFKLGLYTELDSDYYDWQTDVLEFLRCD